MKQQNIRTLQLVIITLIYLIIGALVFKRMESDNEYNQHNEYITFRDAFMNNHSITNLSEFDNLWEFILERKVYRIDKKNYQWRFMDSFFFCIGIVTLIGNISHYSIPNTKIGTLNLKAVNVFLRQMT